MNLRTLCDTVFYCLASVVIVLAALTMVTSYIVAAFFCN